MAVAFPLREALAPRAASSQGRRALHLVRREGLEPRAGSNRGLPGDADEPRAASNPDRRGLRLDRREGLEPMEESNRDRRDPVLHPHLHREDGLRE